jgi:RNA polymerase sigma-70 factor (ECF subfamily)
MKTQNLSKPMKLSPSILEYLVEEHYANLYRFALNLTRNEAEANELTQQTYFILVTQGGKVRGLEEAKVWLFTALRQEFLRRRRKSGCFTTVIEVNAQELESPETIEDKELKIAQSVCLALPFG